LAGLVAVGLALAAPGAAGAAPRAGRTRGANARTGRATPPVAELVRAARKNDRAALERLAARFGVARLGEAVASRDEAVALAALAAVPVARGGALLAGVVADRMDGADAAVASASARTLGELLAGDTPGALAAWELPPDVLARACGGLRALAGRAAAPLTPRLAALDALASARASCGASGDVTALARDGSPAVRRAAVLLLRPADAVAAPALRAAIVDPDPAVAAAATATVCARADAASLRRKGDALIDGAEAAARTLAPAPATRPEDAVEMMLCLAAAATPADRVALDKLRAGPPSAVRDAALELPGGAAAPRVE
jgi:hypothetical protein